MLIERTPLVSITANLTPEKFLKTAGSWLEEKEAQNNILLGLAWNVARKPLDERQENHFWVVKNNKSVSGAAFWTPPYKLTLSEMEPECLAALARKIKKAYPHIPGVFGPQTIVSSFLRAWNEPGIQAVLSASNRLYVLEQVLPVPLVQGNFRPAVAADLELLVQWAIQFREEIKAPEKINERELLEGYLREKRVFVWEHGQVCAMAGFGGATDHAARVNMVYTPRSLRKRGYATNLVASLSQKLLDSGKKFCVLYTDLMNPTSNHIYQKMGYRPVCDWDGYAFEEFRSL